MQLGSELFDQGVLWFKGEEYENAKLYWEDAAKVGNASAMFCLGICYMSSHYYDMDKAIFWFKKAEKAGHKNAKYQLKLLKKDDVAIRKEVADHFFCENDIEYEYGITNFENKVFGDYEWLVVADDVGRELLLSKYIIDIRQYHNFDEDVDWENCELRKWLNNEFIDSFADCYKQRILSVKHKNHNNEKYAICGGNDTKDKCFLLSYDEINMYWNNNKKDNDEKDLLSVENDNAFLMAKVNISDENLLLAQQRTKLDYSMINGRRLGWWLRTPGSSANRAMRINCNGAIRLFGREVVGRLVGVRPAIWVEK